MSQLEKLTLSLIVGRQTSFIDGTHLINDILSKMSRLHTFIFNIITHCVIKNEKILPTPDDLGRALIQRGYNEPPQMTYPENFCLYFPLL
jgi:hypothetical protein